MSASLIIERFAGGAVALCALSVQGRRAAIALTALAVWLIHG